jgi:hypothetical protein
MRETEANKLKRVLNSWTDFSKKDVSSLIDTPGHSLFFPGDKN